jgi:hypothetical protein
VLRREVEGAVLLVVERLRVVALAASASGEERYWKS